MLIQNNGSISVPLSEKPKLNDGVAYSFNEAIAKFDSLFQDLAKQKKDIKSTLLGMIRKEPYYCRDFDHVYKSLIAEFVDRFYFEGSFKVSSPSLNTEENASFDLNFERLSRALIHGISPQSKHKRSFIEMLPRFTSGKYQPFFRSFALHSNKLRACFALIKLMAERPDLIRSFKVFNFGDRSNGFVRGKLQANVLIELNLEKAFNYLPLKICANEGQARSFSQIFQQPRVPTGYGASLSDENGFLSEIWDFGHHAGDSYRIAFPVISTMDIDFAEIVSRLEEAIESKIVNDHYISLDKAFEQLSEEEQFVAFQNSHMLLR